MPFHPNKADFCPRLGLSVDVRFKPTLDGRLRVCPQPGAVPLVFSVTHVEKNKRRRAFLLLVGVRITWRYPGVTTTTVYQNNNPLMGNNRAVGSGGRGQVGGARVGTQVSQVSTGG